MAQVTITINSREYAVACEDGQEVRIIQLSRILDEKARLLTQGGGQVNENMLLAMVGLLLADELTELKKNNGIPLQTPAQPQIDEKQIAELDNLLTGKINSLINQIKSVASKIEFLF